MTASDRQEQRTLMQLLVDTCDEYQRLNGCDRELFGVIALDARGIPQRRITAQHAAELLANTTRHSQRIPTAH